MNSIKKDAVIIGGGPAGLAAAVELYKQGVRDILIVEREKSLGGILRQCIHDGFGLTRFKEVLSGPEYAQRFIDEVERLNISYVVDTTVLAITQDKKVTAVSRNGLITWEAKAVILTMGCRERTRGALGIPGERPAGIFTAGVAQAYINLYNTMVGKNVVILGSGDIGMIMARRLTLEGANVKAVFEILSYPSGLPRNIEQCLNDYNIPLFLSHTVTDIHGRSQLTGVTISKVDERLRPISGTEKEYDCDTLILSVGLIPENELSLGAGVKLDVRTKGAIVDEYYQTGVAGVFAAGNVLHVHDLVDFVSMEAENLANAVATHIRIGSLPACRIKVKTGPEIGYTVPQYISGNQDVQLSLRVKQPFRNCCIQVVQDNVVVSSVKLKKAVPAEMIKIPINHRMLGSHQDLEVWLKCEKNIPA
jgi:NADPH-dependent 2,4-dienoyl-CoA reductase/sulfur reductase-like enzyme